MTIRIMSIGGSLRTDSRSNGVLSLVGQCLRDQGVEHESWLPAERSLAHMDPSAHAAAFSGDALVREFQKRALQSDGFVLATPVYHDSFSGVLKNALDHLSTSSLEGKPVALVSHGGQRTTQAVAQLRIIVRALWGVATPTQLCTQDSDLVLDTSGRVLGLSSEDLVERAARLSSELVAYSKILRGLRRKT